MKSVLKKIISILSVVLITVFYSSCGVKPPKNVILFISDGCGYNQVDATSIYQYGQTGQQIYEQFPVKYAMSTYSIKGIGYNPDSIWTDFKYVKRKPTDSAASATTMATGVKTYNGAIGVDSSKSKLENIVERVEKLGKSTGIVTSVQLSHATPASFAAHNNSRGKYEQISREMIMESTVDVIMGCGHPYFDNDGNIAKDTTYKYVGGNETWQLLMQNQAGSDADNDGIADNWTLIQEKSDFQKLMNGSTPKRVFGLPKVRATLQQSRDGDENRDVTCFDDNSIPEIG